jgi:hypothetical protein
VTKNILKTYRGSPDNVFNRKKICYNFLFSSRKPEGKCSEVKLVGCG